jgi:hypothetical protein
MPLRLILALLGLAVAQPVLGQPQEPPTRVGTVSYVSGNIAFHTAGETQWSAAGVNYPVATGGSFWTDPQARAQIQIGPSTIAMASGTELDVTNLNDQVAQFALPQGRVNLHLRQLDAGQSFEVDLPQGAVWLLQPGSYDIDAGDQNEPARVAAFAGSVRFVGGGADLGINAGEAAVLSGSNPVVARTEHAGPDAFVEWCSAHDYHEAGLAAPYYVSPHMTGYADLDHYGGWQSNSQYGEVWYPSQVPADWAPYRDGRWVWVQPWGWTWVDRQPWGFAPFHYGRWAYADNRWGWVPGSYVAQPVYAPALVAFVGAAAGGLALAGGGGPAVGWFPLAPGEPYWPSYTDNVNYIRNVNITNVRNIDTIVTRSNGAPPAEVATTNFANRRFATVVPQRVFANADPVAPAAIHVAPAALEKAPVVLHPPAVGPVPRPAAGAVRGPTNTRPVKPGPGIPPSVHPGPAAAGVPGAPTHPPGTAPEHAVVPGRPANTAAIPPHPGAATTPERGVRAPAVIGTATAPEAGHGPGSRERGAAPPSDTAGLPPARDARPGVVEPRNAERPGVEPGHPPAAATVRREEAPRPVAAPEHRPAAVNEARPAAPERPEAAPHPRPPEQAQAFHPPAPVARPAPVVHPAPAAVHAPPVEHPARPAQAPAAARPQPAHAPEIAHGGGRPAAPEKGKEEDKKP